MNTAEDNENVIDFAVAKDKLTGGGLPPLSNWLIRLKSGTRFLAQHRNNSNSLLMEFILGTEPKDFKAVFLGYEQPQGFGFRWHDPVRFCQEFAYFDTIETHDDNKIYKGTVEGDGKPEVVNPADAEEQPIPT